MDPSSVTIEFEYVAIKNTARRKSILKAVVRGADLPTRDCAKATSTDSLELVRKRTCNAFMNWKEPNESSQKRITYKQ